MQQLENVQAVTPIPLSAFCALISFCLTPEFVRVPLPIVADGDQATLFSQLTERLNDPARASI